MEIRHFNPEELMVQTVSRFLSESATAYPNEIGSPDLVEWPVKLASHADVFCMQRPDGSLSAALFAYLNPETHIGYIPFFCVLPDPQLSTLNPHRPKGLAYRLHESYRESATQRGMTTLRLEVLQSNTHAINFYTRQGYTIAENRIERNRCLMELKQ